ncbi:diacylglycerol kinase [Aliiglaciecola sp. CAU 1673]|uniref:diacylglycerol kinase n=1 Tax=Aliiglaciecola sp. CAU 1673 TaxID=3032595 RepID=UPI0023DAADF8|nr:diacylglycerol kinase [Aliiglaciecola sp. CAU 1673]MDF2177816.1 diacylglycerol kinase [Aliiglaciecola sp. CAU 1673]
MEKPNGSGLTRIMRATLCSRDGIVYAYRNEAAFRQELLLCLLLIPLALWLTTEPVELILLICPLILLLVVECINSAIEAAIDRISYERHPLSKQAKDLGSAAVFFTMLIILVCWLAIALPKVL